ncbi:MAG TPA: ankyrin repeat domain-containing protein [Lapillicoccus sp.]|nr:ankyrin repeat domain-containing protein [Lapillicoccus sp.]
MPTTRPRATTVALVGAALVAALAAACVSAGPGGSTPTGSALPTPETTTASTSSSSGAPSTRDASGQSDLDQRLRDAAWANDLSAALDLITQGADVNAKDDTQQSAYLVATSEGYLDLLNLTLAHGADVASRDSFNGTGLIRAGERGHTGVVGRLIRAGVEVDHVNRLGWTALHEAIILGKGTPTYDDTVRVLVAGGADVRLSSRRDGVAPLDYARSKGYARQVASLDKALRQDAAGPVDQAEADRRLLVAAAAGDADGVALALRAGADQETTDDRRRTPLLLTVTNDRVDVARVLVALGANPNALDAQHDTPWLVTGVTGSVLMLEALLPAHPDLAVRNRFGGLSVIPASERGHVEYVGRVVQTGIDVNHVNDLGWTALLEAVILGDGGPRHQEIVRILVAAGADRSIADKNGVSPLQHAQRKGHREIAAILSA